MVINNKNWLDDLYCWLHDIYRCKGTFKEFCSLMSDFKKCGITFNELYMASRTSEKIAEDLIELSILTKNNHCYKYRVSEEVYKYFADKCFHLLANSTNAMIFKDFLEREDCAEYKEFDIFVSDEYKTISCRTMDMEPDYTGDNISFFKNIKKNQNIKKFLPVRLKYEK